MHPGEDHGTERQKIVQVLRFLNLPLDNVLFISPRLGHEGIPFQEDIAASKSLYVSNKKRIEKDYVFSMVKLLFLFYKRFYLFPLLPISYFPVSCKFDLEISSISVLSLIYYDYF